MEQLKVGTNDLLSVAKKKVIAAAMLVSSTEAFPMVGLALQLEVPMMTTISIPGRKVGEECWNFDLDGRLEAVAASIQLEAAVAATSEVARLWETLPTASWVLGPYENPCIDVIFRETDDIKTHDFDGFRNVTLLIHQIDIVGLYQCIYIREFPKTAFMCPVVFFVATFESTIL
jgi:hypothetical protein